MAPHQNSFSEFAGKLVVRGWRPPFSNPICVAVTFTSFDLIYSQKSVHVMPSYGPAAKIQARDKIDNNMTYQMIMTRLVDARRDCCWTADRRNTLSSIPGHAAWRDGLGIEPLPRGFVDDRI